MKPNRFKIFFLSFIALFSACVTEKKRLEICNNCAIKSERKDSIVIKTVTVQVKIPGAPGPTLYLENPCKFLCDSLGNLRKINTVVNQNGQSLHIQNLGNGLHIATATKDTTSAASVPQKEIYAKEKTESVKYIPCKNERTSFDGFCRWFFYIVAGLGTSYALYIYIRRKIRIPRPP